MQIPGNSAPGALGVRQSATPGPARQVNADIRPPAKTAGRPAAGTQAGTQADPVRKSTQAAGTPAADLSRARNLEQAVQTLADQGRLPPRGSLIDLRA